MSSRPAEDHQMRVVTVLAGILLALAAPQPSPMPSGPLVFGAFGARFGADGVFTIEGQGWPAFKGSWKAAGDQIELVTPGAAGGCDQVGRYRFTTDNAHVTFDLVSDTCEARRMILDRSTWRPSGEAVAIPDRTIVRTSAPGRAALPLEPPGSLCCGISREPPGKTSTIRRLTPIQSSRRRTCRKGERMKSNRP